jgi:hypothetical protein
MPLPSVGDSVVDDSIPPLEEDDDNAILYVSKRGKVFFNHSHLLALVHHSLQLIHILPHLFPNYLIRMHFPALSNYLNEPLNPEFRLLTIFYSLSQLFQIPRKLVIDHPSLTCSTQLRHTRNLPLVSRQICHNKQLIGKWL